MLKRPTKDSNLIELTQDIKINAFARSVKGSFPDTEDPRHEKALDGHFLRFILRLAPYIPCRWTGKC